MFQVLEQVAIPAPAYRRDLRAELRNVLGYLGFPSGTMIEVTGTCDGGHYAVGDIKPLEPPKNRTASLTGSSGWRFESSNYAAYVWMIRGVMKKISS
jgi:hypothetical protein